MEKEKRYGPMFRAKKTLKLAEDCLVFNSMENSQPGSIQLYDQESEFMVAKFGAEKPEFYLTNLGVHILVEDEIPSRFRYTEILKMTLPRDKDMKYLDIETQNSCFRLKCASPTTLYAFLNRVLVDIQRHG